MLLTNTNLLPVSTQSFKSRVLDISALASIIQNKRFLTKDFRPLQTGHRIKHKLECNRWRKAGDNQCAREAQIGKTMLPIKTPMNRFDSRPSMFQESKRQKGVNTKTCKIRKAHFVHPFAVPSQQSAIHCRQAKHK